jgi:uncharacterized membrane protein
MTDLERLERIIVGFGLSVAAAVILVATVIDPSAVWSIILTALLVMTVFVTAAVVAGGLDWWTSRHEEES